MYTESTTPKSPLQPLVWYPVGIVPPNFADSDIEYGMVLMIANHGIQPGFYFHGDHSYYVHCERYDDFDDEEPEDIDHVTNINNNLEWVTEHVTDVTHWMIIPYPPETDTTSLPSTLRFKDPRLN